MENYVLGLLISHKPQAILTLAFVLLFAFIMKYAYERITKMFLVEIDMLLLVGTAIDFLALNYCSIIYFIFAVFANLLFAGLLLACLKYGKNA